MRLSDARHVEREHLEVVVPAPRHGKVVCRPDHKVVEVRLRFSEEKRGKQGWVCRRTYPESVRRDAKRAMIAALSDTSSSTEEERMIRWQKEVGKVYRRHEKQERKRESAKKAALRSKRDFWLRREQEGRGDKAESRARAARFQKQMDDETIAKESRAESAQRRDEWMEETRDAKSLYDRVRKREVQADITELAREATETSPAQAPMMRQPVMPLRLHLATAN